MISDMKRKELGTFLKCRRERIPPDSYGIKTFGYRRSKGLKREEVAMFSGVSLSWYTWLEQGRDIHVSDQVLLSVSRVLRLSEEETRYMFELADEKMPQVSAESQHHDLTHLQNILDGLTDYPAYAVDEHWNTIAWNHSACVLFGDFSKMDVWERNTLWRMFTRSAYRSLFANWEELAQRLLAQFRMDYGRNFENPWYRDLVTHLNESCDEFRRWWPDYRIEGNRNGIKEVCCPPIGTFFLMHNSFQMVGAQNFTLTVYTPLADDDRNKLAQMLHSSLIL